VAVNNLEGGQIHQTILGLDLSGLRWSALRRQGRILKSVSQILNSSNLRRPILLVSIWRPKAGIHHICFEVDDVKRK
jgi:hypothetical protein